MALKSLFSILMIRISRLAFSWESEAWAVLTMTLEPNSRRMVPSAALEGSVAPRTSRMRLRQSLPW